MWAGYAFSVDFRKKRGHACMLEDQTFTERVQEFRGAEERTVDLRNRAMDALMDLIADIEASRAAGATEKDLAEAREAQRRGQFYVDDLFRKGQVSLRPLKWAAKAAPRAPTD